MDATTTLTAAALRPHNALGGLQPCVYVTKNTGNSTLELST